VRVTVYPAPCVDLRTQTSLTASLLAIAIATSVLLRSRKRRTHRAFGLFGLNIGFWYLTTFLAGVLHSPITRRLNLMVGVFLPLAAVSFFGAFAEPGSLRARRLNRAALISAGALLVATLTPFYNSIFVGTALFVNVFVFVFASLYLLWERSAAARSRFERARLRFLGLVGALAGTFTILEYLPLVGLDLPPVGTVLVLVFLYVLAQSIARERLLDLYELAGRLAVLTVLAFALAAVLWALVKGTGGQFFLHGVVSALVMLVLFDPLRDKVEEMISQIFLRERHDFEHTLADLKGRIAHVLEVDDLVRTLLDGLELSGRVTHAALYLVGPERLRYELHGHFGTAPPERLELGPARPLTTRLDSGGAVVLEWVERELEERRELGEDREAETLYELLQTMEALQAGICLGIRSTDGELYGLLCVRDERVRDAFSPEEVQFLRAVANQAAVALENSRLYLDMKERDRLASLGEMAAGLAHEIRNPLGAIKASAQYLEDPETSAHEGREFLDIIVEEVDRLDHVVGSFLDYARPGRSDAAPLDVNLAVERTLQILGPELSSSETEVVCELANELPFVAIEGVRLRQVLINLVQNSVQAMGTGGRVTLSTRESRGHGVEVHVEDTGPGIDASVRDTLFLPFVTTRERGTGLGLAVSQRLVTAAGGLIQVRSRTGRGTTFVVRLPAARRSEA